MKGVLISEYGDANKLQLTDVPTPNPGAGEVLVKLHFSGVNFTDVYTRRGIYRASHTYQNKPPFIPGMEGAGIIEAVGPTVTRFTPGDRIAYCLSRGSYAEYAVVPEKNVVKVPGEIELRVAAALILQGCTAHYLTHSLFPLGEEHTCLVHAGAGGVGQQLIQLASLRGARVLATVGSGVKARIVQALGADLAILYREVDFVDAVRKATNGRGVDVVYENIGQATFNKSLRCIRPRGLCVLTGGPSGHVESVDPLELAECGSLYLTRPHMADYMSTTKEIAWRTDDIFRYVAKNETKVNIDREFPLASAAAAHTYLEEGRTTGKVLLSISNS